MSVKVSKILAAGCQLDTAIELYFEQRDDVSICVLLHSAWSLLKDLSKAKKQECSRDLIAGCLPSFPELENEKALWKLLDSYWQFFKHAKNDPDAVLEFDADYLGGVIFFAIYDFSQLHTMSKLMEVFQLWFIAKHPELFDSKLYEHATTMANHLFPNFSRTPEREQKQAALRVWAKYAQDDAVLRLPLHKLRA